MYTYYKQIYIYFLDVGSTSSGILIRVLKNLLLYGKGRFANLVSVQIL